MSVKVFGKIQNDISGYLEFLKNQHTPVNQKSDPDCNQEMGDYLTVPLKEQ